MRLTVAFAVVFAVLIFGSLYWDWRIAPSHVCADYKTHETGR